MQFDETSVAVRIDYAKLSLPGNRQENQDKVDVFSYGSAALLVVVDGMGGHAEGARAAEVTVATLRDCFAGETRPVLDPQGFLTLALAQAHARVVELGHGVAMDHKPRATCAVCLVQDRASFWAHVGDSRIYQLRGGGVQERTRDHSHVELLLREGLIAEGEARSHPMRNFVECCLGGDTPLPNMSITARKRLEQGDVLMVCTDGLWTGVEDAEIASLSDGESALSSAVDALARQAVSHNAPHSDNTSLAALRWLGD
jgi:PPM family protein phosphatase